MTATKATFDVRRLDEAAHCYLPREAIGIETDRLARNRYEVRCGFPLNFDCRLPLALGWARAVADHFERQGICLAFDVNPSFGFNATFEVMP